MNLSMAVRTLLRQPFYSAKALESDASRGIGNSLAHVRMADLSLQYSNAEKTGLNPAKCRCESDLEHHFRPRIPMQRK